MKHQTVSRSTKSNFQDQKLDNGEHGEATATRKHRPVHESVQKRPLAGRIFYLDLPCNKRSDSLETDIKSLGGTVEKFFSKDIRYLVSSKPEARHVHRLVQDSPVPSPDSGLSSPHPGSKRDDHSLRGSSQGPADTVVVSRGKSLVEKVIKDQERVKMNRILSNALDWGVKILYVDDVISYVERKKSLIANVKAANHSVKQTSTDGTAIKRSKSGRIRHPFVKVEDCSRHYHPLYLSMANMPICNLGSAAPCSPFLEKNYKHNPVKHTQVHGSGGDRKKSRKDRHRVGKGRRKEGFCECCIVQYDNLNAHLQSEQHQVFSKSDEYLVVDRVISGLRCDFIHISPRIQRVKCSVTSPLIIPRPATRMDREMEVGEDVPDETALCSSYSTDRSVRKRSREQSENPKADLAGQSEVLQKSGSKRGSFDWESGSNAAFQKTVGTAVCSTTQSCLSENLERPRTSLFLHVEQRTSLQSTRRIRLSDPAFSTTHSSLGAGTFHTVSEPSALSDFQTTTKLLLDFPECTTARPSCDSDKTPITHRGPTTDEMSSSSKDILSRALQRKVKTLSRRQTTPSEPLYGLSGKTGDSQSLQGPRKVSKSWRLSASALDLWQFFQSSDGTEEEFKGFL